MSGFTQKSPRFNLLKNRSFDDEPTANEKQAEVTSKRPLSTEALDIGDVFNNLIAQVRSNIPANGQPVDIEIKLESLDVTEKGFLVFSRTSKSKNISVSLATRILPSTQ